MKRIAALSLVAAMAATGVAADEKKVQPTVSTQVGAGLLGGLGGLSTGALAAIIATTIVVGVAVADSNNTTSTSGT